ncbi:MAG: SynChlorMet cassette protein ScmD [Proteobacteria bacterium]|nr:SynChlorMet cassette protein ScmD [Pseudomonadota bacterium]
MIKSEDKPVRNEMLVLREEFDDWAILFDPDTGEGFGLNPVSVFVWKHLDGQNTMTEITKKVLAHFDETPENAHDEINEFVENLLKKGYAGYET